MDVLIIDDERKFDFPHSEVVYARNLADAEILLFRYEWDQVWLDNDLGESREEVRTLVKKVEALAHEGTILNVGEFVIHTQNVVARQEFVQALSEWYSTKIVVDLRAFCFNN